MDSSAPKSLLIKTYAIVTISSEKNMIFQSWYLEKIRKIFQMRKMILVKIFKLLVSPDLASNTDRSKIVFFF